MKLVLRMMEAADLQRGVLETLPFMEKMLGGHGTRDDYRRFLLDLYHVVKHFCPVMAAALSRCTRAEEDLRRHLYESLADERDHEVLVEEDLEDLLEGPGQPELHRPSPPVRAMIGANYWYGDRGNPWGVVGMLYVLEFIASCYAGTLADSLAESIPGSSSCFRFLASHSSLDQLHVANLHALLDKITDNGAQEAIFLSTELNFYLFRNWIEYLGRRGA